MSWFMVRKPNITGQHQLRYKLIKQGFLVGGFNPSQKILVELDHFPKYIEVKIKIVWNHHPVLFIPQLLVSITMKGANLRDVKD